MASGFSLSKEELEALGVTKEETDYGELFVVPCVICGLPVRTRTYSTEKVYKCRLCREQVLRKQHTKKKIAK